MGKVVLLSVGGVMLVLSIVTLCLVAVPWQFDFLTEHMILVVAAGVTIAINTIVLIIAAMPRPKGSALKTGTILQILLAVAIIGASAYTFMNYFPCDEKEGGALAYIAQRYAERDGDSTSSSTSSDSSSSDDTNSNSNAAATTVNDNMTTKEMSTPEPEPEHSNSTHEMNDTTPETAPRRLAAQTVDVKYADMDCPMGWMYGPLVGAVTGLGMIFFGILLWVHASSMNQVTEKNDKSNNDDGDDEEKNERDEDDEDGDDKKDDDSDDKKDDDTEKKDKDDASVDEKKMDDDDA